MAVPPRPFEYPILVTASPTVLNAQQHFVHPLPKAYECAICMSVMRNSVVVCKAGHCFCDICIRWVQPNLVY